MNPLIEPFMQTVWPECVYAICSAIQNRDFYFPFFFVLGFFLYLYPCCLARNGRVGHIKLNLLLLSSHWITGEFLARVFLAVFRNAPKILGKHYKLDVNGIRETAATSFACWLIFFWVTTIIFRHGTPIRLSTLTAVVATAACWWAGGAAPQQWISINLSQFYMPCNSCPCPPGNLWLDVPAALGITARWDRRGQLFTDWISCSRSLQIFSLFLSTRGSATFFWASTVL